MSVCFILEADITPRITGRIGRVVGNVIRVHALVRHYPSSHDFPEKTEITSSCHLAKALKRQV